MKQLNFVTCTVYPTVNPFKHGFSVLSFNEFSRRRLDAKKSECDLKKKNSFYCQLIIVSNMFIFDLFINKLICAHVHRSKLDAKCRLYSCRPLSLFVWNEVIRLMRVRCVRPAGVANEWFYLLYQGQKFVTGSSQVLRLIEVMQSSVQCKVSALVWLTYYIGTSVQPSGTII